MQLVSGQFVDPKLGYSPTHSAAPKIENFASTPQRTETEKTDDELSKKIFNYAKMSGIGLTSALHFWAGIKHLLNFKSNERSSLDEAALNTSKFVLVGQCLFETYQAIKKNRVVEALARFIEPLFLVAESRVEDLGLARGLGLGISQLVGSQEGIYNELAMQKYGVDVKKKDGTQITKGQDLDLNIDAMYKIFKEIALGGFFSGRRFLTGFSIKNIKEKLKLCVKDFNFKSCLDLINPSNGDFITRYTKFLEDSGLKHIRDLFQGDKERDKGHTDAVSGYLMILGSVLGYMGKANKNILYKLGGTLRNLGGAVADVAIFGHPDPGYSISALFLSINTFMDIVQRFIPQKMLNIILPWSNFSMSAYNIGVGLYLHRSSAKSDEGDKIQYHDTDLASRKSQSSKKVPASETSIASDSSVTQQQSLHQASQPKTSAPTLAQDLDKLHKSAQEQRSSLMAQAA